MNIIEAVAYVNRLGSKPVSDDCTDGKKKGLMLLEKRKVRTRLIKIH